jgi:SAM-dependent methyltransferase
MPRHVRPSELLVGVEGLALLRNAYDGSDEQAAARIAEVRELLVEDGAGAAEAIEEWPPQAGYAAWAAGYDEPGNPIVALEQPALWRLLESTEPGRALDAACGTGRHSQRLVELGHEVDGFDESSEMLERARRNVPAARFLLARLESVPGPDDRFDLVVCGLALSHLERPAVGIAELARVLCVGGRMLISVLHPMLALLGWHAPFVGADGTRGFVREHPHTHADYLAAFAASGLSVLGALEPRLAADHVRSKRRAFGRIPEATLQAYVGLPGVLVWDLEKLAA